MTANPSLVISVTNYNSLNWKLLYVCGCRLKSKTQQKKSNGGDGPPKWMIQTNKMLESMEGLTELLLSARETLILCSLGFILVFFYTWRFGGLCNKFLYIYIYREMQRNTSYAIVVVFVFKCCNILLIIL